MRESLLQKRGERASAFPSGGTNALGVFGYIEAVEELRLQLQLQSMKAFDHIYGSRFGAWIVLVGHHGRDHKNIDMLWASMGIDIPGKTSRDLIRIINGFGSGYAVSTLAELDCIAHIARKIGVVLDPVYIYRQSRPCHGT